MALPLDMVERIESVSLERIEYAGGRPLLQYRGELLPLKDQGSVLPDLEAMQQRGEEVQATVLICGDRSLGGEQRLGMVVRQVLDVSAGTLLERDAMSDAAGMELGSGEGEADTSSTQVGTKVATAWQEVA